MTSPTSPGRVPTERLNLEFPRSLAVYDTYEDAQRSVDYLSDHEFPVQNVLIVGTDLKQIERVTGRLTWSKVIAGGLLSGMWLGAFVGLIFGMFGEAFSLGVFLSVVLTGALFGVVWAAIGYAFTRGQRDFTSVSQVVATRYEVLVEHALFERAREMLSQLPGSRGTLGPATTGSAAGGASGPARPNPYEGRYGIRTDDEGRPADAEQGRSRTSGATALSRPSGPSGTSAQSGTEPTPTPGGPANEYEGRYGVRLPEGERESGRPSEAGEDATGSSDPRP